LTANWLTIFKTATDPSPRPPEKPKYKSPSRQSQKSGKCEVTQVHIDLKPYEGMLSYASDSTESINRCSAGNRDGRTSA